jgi:hypothetical protein
MTQRTLFPSPIVSSLILLVFSMMFLWTVTVHAQPANDECAAAIVVSTVPFANVVDTTAATVAAGDPVHTPCTSTQDSHTVWYRFTPAMTGTVTAFTGGSDYDTVMAVFSGSCDALTPVACNDDVGAASMAAEVEFSAAEGVTYLIEVAAFGDDAGGTLHLGLSTVNPATNDACNAATAITSVPFLDITDTSAATTAVSDPLQSCALGEPAQNFTTVWYALTALVDAAVTARTVGSSYDTVVTAYTGSCNALTEIACNDDASDTVVQSDVTFATTAGTTYLIEVTSFDPPGGRLEFAVSSIPAAKAADKCRSGIAKAGSKFAAARLKGLGACVNGVLKCVETKPADLDCVPAAKKKCETGLGKIAAARAKLVASIVKSCDPSVVSFASLMSPSGLGYDALADECSALGTTLADVDSIAECLAQLHECQVDKLLEAEEPRADELLDFSGVGHGPSSCLSEYPGTGSHVPDAATGKLVDACESAIKKAGATFAKAKSSLLQKCVATVFRCVVTKPDDDGCLLKAGAACEKVLAKIPSAGDKLAVAVEKKCGDMQLSYDTLRLPEAANLDALGDECTTFGASSLATLPDYENCLTQQHGCRAAELVREVAPRAEMLLGLVGHELRDSFCPEPSPVPTPGP